MNTKFLITKRVLVLVCVAVFYIGFWLLTHFFGETQVRNIARDAFMKTHLDAMSAPGAGERPPVIPQYRVIARAYAPFLVRVEYAWMDGAHGAKDRSLFFWCFGSTSKIRDYGHESL
jgi:hypothetical protein